MISPALPSSLPLTGEAGMQDAGRRIHDQVKDKRAVSFQ